ncbi:MAG TPA: DUF2783 domain-containing protein [Stellaceae bacterium]|nr:DUF2783 domain-containing protein [Stellaceae bacterium]
MNHHLKTEPRLADPDGFYAELIALFHELDAQQSLQIQMKLVLLLANHIGDIDVLREAMAAARG